jgi:hypothetical protein
MIVSCLLIFLCSSIQAQERQKSITVNIELQNQTNRKEPIRLKSVQSTTVELPFIDDFSSTTVYPDPKIWSDSNVYINSNFAINLKTIGVASFDIFDAQGNIYKNAQSEGFGADTLTSNPINLNYPETSNIWMSFYIQPGGLGDEPDIPDSLKLEFFMTDSGKWKTVWSTPGFSSPSFTYKSVPINQPEYLKNGFRFRFVNLASLTTSDIEGKTSIPDVWNLDYVKIDTARNETDSLYWDIAYSKPLKSLLKSYHSMPWSHYLFAFVQEVQPKIDANIVNFTNGPQQPLITWDIKELYSTFEYTEDIGLQKIEAWSYNLRQMDLSNPFKSKNQDSAIYKIRSFLGQLNDSLIYDRNDTVKFTQVFKNYFAYDDGTAESGYGISGQGAQNAMAAYGFYSYFPDTLRSVRISFNPTENNITESYYFKLAVWSNNNGKPGTLIYLDPRERNPIISKRGGFVKFDLDSGILVNEGFFVGWTQSSEDYLNIGYDLNNPNGQSHLFYNINGTWIPSGTSSNVKPGSLMIRPIMRTEKLVTGIPSPFIPEENTFTVFPNPAQDFVVIKSDLNPDDKITGVTIFNPIGQLIKIIGMPTGNIDISELKPGLYILKIQTKKGKTETVKLLKEI